MANSGTPVLKDEVGAELLAPLGAVDQVGDNSTRRVLAASVAGARGKRMLMVSLRSRSAGRSRQAFSK